MRSLLSYSMNQFYIPPLEVHEIEEFEAAENVNFLCLGSKLCGFIGVDYSNGLPIGSMYAIYGDIYHQYTPNVSIYAIHGSYGL